MTASKPSTGDYKKRRVEEIIQMLIEMADGNFSYRIEIHDNDDEELRSLITAINLTSDELGGYVDLKAKPEAVMAFVVDENLNIKSINDGVQKNLRYNDMEIQNRSMNDFVTADSKLHLEVLRACLANGDTSDSITIHFRTKSAYVLAASCAVTSLIDPQTNDRRFLILAIESVKQITEAKNEKPYEIQFDANGKLIDRWDLAKREACTTSLHENDYVKIQKVYSTIQSSLHLHWSLDMLADNVGMEIRTLTKLFRKFHGKSVMQFVIEQRMIKAENLLKDRSLQLKEIAQAVGYKNLSHFSKKFKKIYGYSPSEFRQR